MASRLLRALTVLLTAWGWSTVQAFPVIPVSQPAAPVQLQSCSALTFDSTSAPEYGKSFATTVSDSSGRIVYTGPPVLVDQQIPMVPLYAGTSVYASAESVNRSAKTVSAVTYRFDVFSGAGARAAMLFGSRTGMFAENARITPYGAGLLSPWTASLDQPYVSSVRCLVAQVKFSDGTSWLSPLATAPTRLPAK